MNIKAQLHELLTYRPAKLDLPDQFVYPRYEGRCTTNLAATAAQALGASLPVAAPPLAPDLLDGMLDGVQRVVILVMDALGWNALNRIMEAHPDLPFHAMAEQGRLQPITTSFPSTTNSVMNSIWSGHPPLEHGTLGFEMWLREFRMVAETIGFSSPYEMFAGTLLKWGFEPEAFPGVPGIGQMLSVQGVLSYALIHKSISSTPLSRMNFRGVREVRTHTYSSDFWIELRRLLEEHRGERMLLGGYWSAVDSLAHHYGPLDEIADAEIVSLGMLMDELFLQRMDPADREGTLLLMTADHGQVTVPESACTALSEHPKLDDMLMFAPTGESRVPFFYARSGALDEVSAYLHENFADDYLFLSREEVLQSGLLGPDLSTMYKEVPFRLGDIVGISLNNSAFDRAPGLGGRLKGRHGSLLADEMLVPLLALRLDA